MLEVLFQQSDSKFLFRTPPTHQKKNSKLQANPLKPLPPPPVAQKTASRHSSPSSFSSFSSFSSSLAVSSSASSVLEMRSPSYGPVKGQQFIIFSHERKGTLQDFIISKQTTRKTKETKANKNSQCSKQNSTKYKHVNQMIMIWYSNNNLKKKTAKN